MAGIMPDGGVSAASAQGADPTIVAGDLVNCPGGPLFNPTNRCNVRFDPKSQNALISEALNLVKSAGIDYDCSRFDNLATAVGVLLGRLLTDCLTQNFPVATGANACSIQQLVLMTEPSGCIRIARYDEDTAVIGGARNSSVWGNGYPQAAHPLAGQTTPNVHLYEAGTLAGAVAANNVNPAVLFGPGNQNALGTLLFNLACDSSVTIEYEQQMAFEPKQNNGDGTRSVVVIMVDGAIPLQADGQPINFGPMSNFQGTYRSSITRQFSAGAHTLQFFLVSLGFPEPARVLVQGSPVATGGSWTARIS